MMNVKKFILSLTLLMMTAVSFSEVITYKDEIKEIEIENELTSRLQTAIESYLGHNENTNEQPTFTKYFWYHARSNSF